MEIFLAIVILIASFLLLIWGGDKFVDSCIGVSKKLKISPVIVGATITSIGTTLPELLVTIFAGASNSSSLAIGNAMGSIIFNSCIIGGILLICLTIKNQQSKAPAMLLILSVLFVCVSSFNKQLDLWECILLLVLFMVFFVLNIFYEKIKSRNSIISFCTTLPDNTLEKEYVTVPPTDSQKLEQTDPSGVNVADKELGYYFLKFLISAIAIGVGAYFLVEKAKFLASCIGINDTIIGLTIVGFGTSLPELITTISSIRKKEASLGLGNIMGSNIINCTLLIALSGILSGSALAFDYQSLIIGIPFCLIATLLLLLPNIIKKRTYKWQGIGLITLYSIYFILLLINV